MRNSFCFYMSNSPKIKFSKYHNKQLLVFFLFSFTRLNVVSNMPKPFPTIISKFREPSQHKALTIDQRIIISDPIIYQCLVIIKKNDFHLTKRHFFISCGSIIFGGLHFWRHWFNMAKILSKFGEQQLVMLNYACGFNQSNTGKYFEWIIILFYWLIFFLWSERGIFPLD